MDQLFNANLIVLFPLFFAGMWVLTTFFIAKRGWSALADRYETFADFTGTRVGVISAMIGKLEYKNSLVLRYNETGFYLRPVVLFRLFHKPLLIPWQEIRQVREKKTWLRKNIELTIGDPPVSTVRISDALFRRLSPYIPAAAQPPGDRY